MKRYELTDTLRGLSIISMIVFHTCWIMSHFGLLIPQSMLTGTAFTIWERSICIAFISIAGFSFSLGHDHLRSGLKIFAWGLVIMLVTIFLIPGIRIVFGILTFIGTATLLMIPLDKALNKIVERSRTAAAVLFAVALGLFLLTYHINIGYIGFTAHPLMLPEWLYRGLFATFIGFMEPGFVSDDYFSVLPWYFVYVSGYAIHKLIRGTKAEGVFEKLKIPGINSMGRHSLAIYLIHPVIIYLVLMLLTGVFIKV
jgi:uncharacterized membrane protein